MRHVVTRLVSEKRAEHQGRKEAHILLEASLQGSVCIEAVKADFESVLSNLINNSFESIPERKPGEIRVTLAVSGEQLEIRIADNGAGMSSADLDKIGNSRFTSKAETGNGLGLLQAKSSLAKMSGTLAVQSRVGAGTEVTLRIPLLQT